MAPKHGAVDARAHRISRAATLWWARNGARIRATRLALPGALAGLLRSARNDVDGLFAASKSVIARSSCDEAIQSFCVATGLLRSARNGVERTQLRRMGKGAFRAVARILWEAANRGGLLLGAITWQHKRADLHDWKPRYYCKFRPSRYCSLATAHR
jgi:hypothetical protein